MPTDNLLRYNLELFSSYQLFEKCPEKIPAFVDYSQIEECVDFLIAGRDEEPQEIVNAIETIQELTEDLEVPAFTWSRIYETNDKSLTHRSTLPYIYKELASREIKDRNKHYSYIAAVFALMRLNVLLKKQSYPLITEHSDTYSANSEQVLELCNSFDIALSISDACWEFRMLAKKMTFAAIDSHSWKIHEQAIMHHKGKRDGKVRKQGLDKITLADIRRAVIKYYDESIEENDSRSKEKIISEEILPYIESFDEYRRQKPNSRTVRNWLDRHIEPIYKAALTKAWIERSDDHPENFAYELSKQSEPEKFLSLPKKYMFFKTNSQSIKHADIEYITEALLEK